MMFGRNKDGAPEKGKSFLSGLKRQKSAADPENSEHFATDDQGASPEATAAASPEKKVFGLSFTSKKASPDKGKVNTKKTANSVSGAIVAVDEGAFSIGKHNFAIGVYWTAVNEEMRLKAQIANINERNNNDPSSRLPQYNHFVDPKGIGFLGLASVEVGHKAGMVALITAISPDLTGQKWIGAFQISVEHDIWWVGAMRDGRIFEDLIARGKEKAQAAFFRELQAPDWDSVFAPAEWGVPGGRQDDLSTLINLKLGKKIGHVAPLKVMLPKILLSVLVVSVVAGGYTYYSNKQAKEAAELEEMRKRIEAEINVGPTDYPWDKTVPFSTFIGECRYQISQSIFTVPGWELQPISCAINKGVGTVTTGWDRKGGRISWLRSGVPASMTSSPVLSKDGKKASITFSFQVTPDQDSWTQAPWKPEQIDSWITERFQNVGLEVKLKADAKNATAAKAVPVFNSHNLQVTTAVGLSNFGDLLNDVPALVPTALIYTPGTMNWDIMMKIYHPPLMPDPNKAKKKPSKAKE